MLEKTTDEKQSGGLICIKTTDKGVVDVLVKKNIPIRHMSNSATPNAKTYFFEVTNEVAKSLYGKIIVTKISEIDALINLPKTIDSITLIGTDKMIAEMERRGYKVSKEEKAK